MPKSRHRDPEREVLVRTYPLRLPGGSFLNFHYADWVQLVYAAKGVLVVSTTSGSWVVPPNRAIWMPAGLIHRVESHGECELRCLYFHASSSFPMSCQTVSVTPLARELINHVAITGVLLRARPDHRRLAGVLLDQLSTLPSVPTHLPLPTDPEAAHAASLLLDWNRSLDSAAFEAGLSRRTMERRFVADTGMSVGMWRQQAKLQESLRHLSAGLGVGTTAYRVGYQNVGAYITAFRRCFGLTPREYVLEGRVPE